MTDKTAFKRPESVLVLIYSETGRVLLLERREPEGFWQSVTGSLEWHETPIEAAQRELTEETGWTDQPLACCWTNRFPIIAPWSARYAPDTSENTEYVFRLRLANERSPILAPAEHLGFQWLEPRQAVERVFSWTNRDVIQRYLD